MCIGIVGAVGEFNCLACCDAAGIVVAACDACFYLALCQLELFGLEDGMEQEIERRGEDGIEVAFQARPVD